MKTYQCLPAEFEDHARKVGFLLCGKQSVDAAVMALLPLLLFMSVLSDPFSFCPLVISPGFALDYFNFILAESETWRIVPERTIKCDLTK